MLVTDFDYELPPELIAQDPIEPRDHSRLMVVQRDDRSVEDHFFYELASFLRPKDLLVFNDTRVIPARLFAHKETIDGAKIEVFLLKELRHHEWECLIRPGKKAKPGTRLIFAGGVCGEVGESLPSGNRLFRFPKELDFRAWLAEYGTTPLPPYIGHTLQDPERYQTVYARNEGSVAAPTAGLHFTPSLLEKLTDQGIRFGFLTLDIGLGTFRPVKADRIEDHVMHPETFSLDEELVAAIRQTKDDGGRVIAVGTTAVRVLESQAAPGELRPGSGETSIFIYPGYKFQVIDGLITNFHLPRSTLLMLVSALAGREFMLNCYRQAVTRQYRFFSFGDAMLIL